LPVRQFAIIGGNIYGHSNAVPETYRLFYGTNDNENTFTAKAYFAYDNFGKRFLLKSFDELAVEGYISSNAILKVILNYDYDGYTQSLEKTIDGSDSNILFEAVNPASLGDLLLGDGSLGDVVDEESLLSKFKTIIDIPKYDNFELQVCFETDATDYQWEILAFGPNVSLSPNLPITSHI
jgi:hypothetical protein